MVCNLYNIILCPEGSEPTKENVTSIHVIADCIVEANNVAFVNFSDQQVVSVSFADKVYLRGSLVDFE